MPLRSTDKDRVILKATNIFMYLENADIYQNHCSARGAVVVLATDPSHLRTSSRSQIRSMRKDKTASWYMRTNAIQSGGV